ncbi:hypothetical protein BN1723_000103 [Verticillium longisporum]|uniref:Uncharacterized protein n=1 Tax=Verticillium longisporum TaxID=100787 RepID=A0A0G4KET7_VERLO|nr:hypothetical protein BN1723_000103 [Verticillium longisporum]
MGALFTASWKVEHNTFIPSKAASRLTGYRAFKAWAVSRCFLRGNGGGPWERLLQQEARASLFLSNAHEASDLC